MPKTQRPSADLLALQRSQLDAKLNSAAPIGDIDLPQQGWIRTMRTALAMSQAQLGKRLGLTRAAVSGLESREIAGAITLATLRKAAEALDCSLVIAFVPNKGLQTTIEEQVRRKMASEQDRVMHTMRLEAQDAGVGQALTRNVGTEDWLRVRSREIWD